MTINKYQGRTKEEAVEKAKQEMGEGTVILNVKEIKPKGIFQIFKNTTYEVTAAVEEKEAFTVPKKAENISLAADEKIALPKSESDWKEMLAQARAAEPPAEKATEPAGNNLHEDLERRLENLSNMLEKQFAAEHPVREEIPEVQEADSESLRFMKMLYRTLLENEVNERYVNQIMEEGEKVLHNGSSVDMILANVYQKLILKLGQPEVICADGKKPRVIFFIGPTGVGKTTTLAKIASKYKVEYEKKVAFLTADTYRIAATDQLRTYANILDAPMSIIYTVEEMNRAIAQMSDYDLVFVDTAGFSHHNDTQRDDMKKLLDGLDEAYEKEVYLVLSATTKYRDLLEIADIYKELADYRLIFTKLDETSAYGNILNIRLYSGAKLSYMTVGQNVPEDIEVFDMQKLVKQLLGGR